MQWEDDFTLTAKLFRILQGKSPHEMIAEVIGGAEFRGARVVQSHMGLRVFTNGDGQVGRTGRYAHTVRSLQAPCLASQELPPATL